MMQERELHSAVISQAALLKLIREFKAVFLILCTAASDWQRGTEVVDENRGTLLI